MSSGRDVVTEKLGNSRFAETPIGEKVLSAMDTTAGARAIKKNGTEDTLATSGTTTTGRTTTTSNTAGTTDPSTGTSY